MNDIDMQQHDCYLYLHARCCFVVQHKITIIERRAKSKPDGQTTQNKTARAGGALLAPLDQ